MTSGFDRQVKGSGRPFLEASAGIEEILHEDVQDVVNPDWLVSHFFDRSPEMLFLIFTPAAIVPATSTFAGAFLLIVAIRMIFHHRSRYLPRSLALRSMARATVESVFHGLIAVLKAYEAYAARHPHPPAARHTRRVGFMIAILASTLLVPLPFSNVLPGFAIGTVALASLEQDGNLMLIASLLTTISVLAVTAEAFSAFHLVARIL